MWRLCIWKISVLFTCLMPINAIPGIVETVAGGGKPHTGKDHVCNDYERTKDGVGMEAYFNYPWGIAYDHHNHAIYVSDCGCLESEHRNDLIRKIDLLTMRVSTIAGSTQGFADGHGDVAHFQHIAGIVVDPELELLYIADSGNNRIRVLYLATNKVDTVAGLPAKGYADQSTISSRFNNPQAVAVYRNENLQRKLYVADTDNHAIRVIHLESDTTGQVKTLAGGKKGFKDGLRLEARFSYPSEIVIDTMGKYIYVSDHYNHAIRRIEVSSGSVNTLTKSGFQMNVSPSDVFLKIYYPEGLVHDPDRDLLYVCEFKNDLIQVITMDGLVKPLAGGIRGKKDGIGKLASFYHPSGLTFDRKGKVLYVSDQYNHRVRSVSAVGSSKKYINVKKTKLQRKLQNSQQEQQYQPKTLINPNMHWTLMIAISFVLVMFGALIVRPCFRLLFKFVKGEQQLSFQYFGL